MLVFKLDIELSEFRGVVKIVPNLKELMGLVIIEEFVLAA